MLLHEIINQGRRQDIAIIDKDNIITYEKLVQIIDSNRNKLYELGIRQGDRVGLFSKNRAEFICTYLAIASIGAVTVPVNYQLTNKEIAYILKNAGIKHIFTDTLPRFKDYLSDEDYMVACHEIRAFNKINDKLAKAPELPVDFSSENPCAIIYTSGTMGKSKGAVLSHKNLVCNTEQMIHMDCKKEHNVLCVLPMYHGFSWTASVLYPLFCGASVVILENFVIKDMLEVIKNKKITDIYIVPSICSLLNKLAKSDDLSTLRLVVCGGAPLPLQVSVDFTEKFGLPICEAYGLSEASPMVTINPASHAKTGSVGMLMPGIEARFVDSDCRDVPKGCEGELLIKGNNVMLGYWNMPEATKEVIDKEGWLHTGDILKIDNDGYLYIVNRLKELIISMGENIYPREVEEIIYHFPDIKDAAVIGVHDEMRGQTAVCFYSMQEGAEMDIRKLRNFLQENLALYKIPKEFHQLNELPRTSTGKILKKQILGDFLKNKQ